MIPGLQLLDGKARKLTLLGWRAVPSLNLAYHPTHVVLDLGCTRSIGSRSAIEILEKHSWYYGKTKEFCSCDKSFVFEKSETATCLESCIIHPPTTPFSLKRRHMSGCSAMCDVTWMQSVTWTTPRSFLQQVFNMPNQPQESTPEDIELPDTPAPVDTQPPMPSTPFRSVSFPND